MIAIAMPGIQTLHIGRAPYMRKIATEGQDAPPPMHVFVLKSLHLPCRPYANQKPISRSRYLSTREEIVHGREYLYWHLENPATNVTTQTLRQNVWLRRAASLSVYLYSKRESHGWIYSTSWLDSSMYTGTRHREPVSEPSVILTIPLQFHHLQLHARGLRDTSHFWQ